MKRAILLSLLMPSLLMMGCPESRSPDPQPTAQPIATMPPPVPTPPPPTPAGTLKGGWTVQLSSKAPGLNPDMFDTPEKKAKVFFDHHASVSSDKVVVDHKTLGKQFDADATAGQKLETRITGTDWAAVATRVKTEGSSEGGTEFRFIIDIGGTKHEIVTHHLEKHAELVEIVDALKTISGVP